MHREGMQMKCACLLALVLLTGCSTIDLPEEPLTDRPSASAARAVTEAWAKKYMKDPTSFLVRNVTEPKVRRRPGPLFGLVRGRIGWSWTAELNGKNGSGGYAGWTTYRFYLFADGSWWGTVW
jgi:hypothetical protein